MWSSAGLVATTTTAEVGVTLDAGKSEHYRLVIDAEGQRLLYIAGRTIYHASAGYRRDGKTDAKDAAVIADQARMRRDL
ncbi:IS110 family transposase, partial [Mycobacterium attenuatum]|uniref:IS110 family transposase n=1 Tax=Mycobacterium attenuatum TaxID=2341086 RepID=UPI003CC7D599